MFTSTHFKSCQACRRENCAHERQQLQSRLHKSGAPKLQIKARGRNSRPGKIALQVTEIPDHYSAGMATARVFRLPATNNWKLGNTLLELATGRVGPSRRKHSSDKQDSFESTQRTRSVSCRLETTTQSRVRWVVAAVAFPSKTSLPFGRTLTRVND